MNFSLPRLAGALTKSLTTLFLWGLLSPPAWAATCTATMPNISFGDVDLINGSGAATTSATLKYSCNVLPILGVLQFANVCFNAGSGVEGSGNSNPRVMKDSAGHIFYFQLTVRSTKVAWGSLGNTALPSPARATIAFPLLGGTVNGEIIIDATLVAAQTMPFPGFYQDQFTGTQTSIQFQSQILSTPASCSSGTKGTFPFTVSATLVKSCKVTATDMDFGSAVDPLSASKINGQSLISASCTNSTPYTVALSPSNGSTVGAGTMAPTGGIPSNTDKVPYALYRNAARTQVWGSQINTNTAAGIGTGLNQNLTVYGKVSDTAFTPDSYQDIVTVNVNY